MNKHLEEAIFNMPSFTGDGCEIKGIEAEIQDQYQGDDLVRDLEDAMAMLELSGRWGSIDLPKNSDVGLNFEKTKEDANVLRNLLRPIGEMALNDIFPHLNGDKKRTNLALRHLRNKDIVGFSNWTLEDPRTIVRYSFFHFHNQMNVPNRGINPDRWI